MFLLIKSIWHFGWFIRIILDCNVSFGLLKNKIKFLFLNFFICAIEFAWLDWMLKIEKRPKLILSSIMFPRDLTHIHSVIFRFYSLLHYSKLWTINFSTMNEWYIQVFACIHCSKDIFLKSKTFNLRSVVIWWCNRRRSKHDNIWLCQLMCSFPIISELLLIA